MTDWTTQAADAIERAVAVVRDKTVVPAQKATRAVVFGLLASFFVGTALTVLTIGVFRGLVILTGDAWIAYLICGGILVLGGAFCWRLRLKKQPKEAQ
jgi:Putative Actinobacterial Holin-X, holin superfamily III